MSSGLHSPETRRFSSDEDPARDSNSDGGHDVSKDSPILTTTIDTPAPRIPKQERTRKLLHMLPGLLVFLMAPIPHYDPLAWHEVGIVAGVAAIVLTTYLKLKHKVQRDGEDNFLITAWSYAICTVTMSALFRSNPEFTALVVVILALGDGSAYFGGKLFGKRKLPWNRQKSWMGTLSFILVSAPIGALAFWFEARPTVPFELAAWCALAAAVAGAIAESLPVKLTDNLRVGVASGVACAVTFFALAPQFNYHSL
jgi:dolichol kinase